VVKTSSTGTTIEITGDGQEITEEQMVKLGASEDLELKAIDEMQAKMGIVSSKVTIMSTSTTTFESTQVVKELIDKKSAVMIAPLVPEGDKKTVFETICDHLEMAKVPTSLNKYWAVSYLLNGGEEDVIKTKQLAFEAHKKDMDKYLGVIKKFDKDYLDSLSMRFVLFRVYSIMEAVSKYLTLQVADFQPKKPVDKDKQEAFFTQVEEAKANIKMMGTAATVLHQELKYQKEVGMGEARKKQAKFSDAIWTKFKTYDEELTELHTKMCQLLQTIVMVYSGYAPYQSTAENMLKLKKTDEPEDERVRNPREIVSEFYQKFYFAVDTFRPATCVTHKVKSLAAAVTMAFAGFDIDDKSILFHRQFFSKTFFTVVFQCQINQEVINFDRLLMLGLNTKADLIYLEELRLQKIPFHITFFNEFNKEYTANGDKVAWDINVKIDSALLELRTSPQPFDEQKSSFILHTYILLYKAYVQLRNDKKITQEMDLPAIRVTMYNWFVGLKLAESNRQLYNGFFIYQEFRSYYAAAVSYLCKLIPGCEDGELERKITEEHIRDLGFNKKTLPDLFYSLIYFTKTIRSFLDKIELEDKINEFYLALLNMGLTKEEIAAKDLNAMSGWEKLTKDCKVLEYTRKGIETSKDLEGKKARMVLYNQQCTGKVYKEYTTLLEKYIVPSLELKIFFKFYVKLSEVMEQYPNFNLRGLLRYLTIRYITILRDNKEAQKKIHPRFVRQFVLDFVISKLKTLKVDYSQGFYSFLCRMLLPNEENYLFRLLGGQETFFYSDLYYLIYWPMFKTQAMNVKFQEANKEYWRFGLENFFKQAPVPQAVEWDKYKTTMDALHDIEAGGSDTGDYYAVAQQLFTLNLLSLNLDFFDFMSTYNEYGDEFARNNANPSGSPFATYYAFVYKLRINMDTEVVDIPRYILEKMEMCLRYTSLLTDMPKDKVVDSLCHLSYRKYAEVYPIYKLFLIMERGYTDISMENYDPKIKPVRTGALFYLANNLSPVSKKFTEICQAETATNVFICKVWLLFTYVLSHIKSNEEESMTYLELMQVIKDKLNVKDDAKGPFIEEKFILLVMFDAFHQATDRIPVINDILLGLFNPANVLEVVGGVPKTDNNIGQAVLWELSNNEDEKKQMAQFLMLNNRKRYTEKNEEGARMAVQGVLATVRDAIAKDKSKPANDITRFNLDNYLTLRNIHHVTPIRVFLMFGDSINDYSILVDYLIGRKVFFEVVNLDNKSVESSTLKIIANMAVNDPNSMDSKNPAHVKKQVNFLRDEIMIILNEAVASAEALNMDFGSLDLDSLSDVSGDTNGNSFDMEQIKEDYDKQVVEEIKNDVRIEQIMKSVEMTVTTSSTDVNSMTPSQEKNDQFVASNAGVKKHRARTPTKTGKGDKILAFTEDTKVEINADTKKVNQNFESFMMSEMHVSTTTIVTTQSVTEFGSEIKGTLEAGFTEEQVGNLSEDLAKLGLVERVRRSRRLTSPGGKSVFVRQSIRV